MTDDIPKQKSGHLWRGKPIEQLSYEEVLTAKSFLIREQESPSFMPSYKEIMDRKDALERLKELQAMYEAQGVITAA